ncbi:MAG: histidine kinase [bacterium]|nr:histidine kinase [bacterium]
MTKKVHIYWYCQIIGWSFYVVVNSIFQGLSTLSTYREYLIYFIMLLAGIAISHAYRSLVKLWHVLRLSVPAQIVFVLVFSFLKGNLFFLLILLLTRIFGGAPIDLNLVTASEYVLNFTVVFCLWNGIYFGFQYFQNYKRVEINSLRYLAASRESELNNLKAQLNPHFIFNCMNSIRALIDEDPNKAKVAVTRLSNMLRSTLLLDKSKVIPLKEELNLVKDYLELEKIRYEERLHYEFAVTEEVTTCLIPPFIIQSQVENAIKHGISKHPGKGTILVEAEQLGDDLKIVISNTGKIRTESSATGVGLTNSAQRLNLLYGNRGTIDVKAVNDLVVVAINIPLK